MGIWKETELHAVFNDGTWRRLNADGTWTQLASGLSTTAEWSFTNFQGNLVDINLIGSNGVDAIKRYDGASVQNLSNAPAGGKYITTYQNRLWCVVDKELRSSSLDNAEDWTIVALNDAKAFGKELESPRGEKANALIGGDDLPKLTIGYPNSLRELFGGVPSDFRDKPVPMDVGLINHKCAVSVDGTMSFFHTKGFYQYSGGVLPDKKFSEVVQALADQSNSTARGKSCVGTDGQKLYFSLSIDSSTTPDTILEYDPRRGVQTWYEWKSIQALHFARIGGDLYIGDALGRVLKLGGTTDGGNPISWHWISVPFTAGSLSQFIAWMAMWLTVDLQAGSTLNVYLSKLVDGDDDWQLAGSITAQNDIQSRPIYFSPGMAANTQYIRVKFEGTGPCTIHEFSRDEQALPIR